MTGDEIEHPTEAWCQAYITAGSIEEKLAPTPRPESSAARGPALRLPAPGRASHLRVIERAEKIPRPGALREASAVAKLLHVFLHHEVQAAELCAWAYLAFPEAPESFQQGLLTTLDDEVRHAALYRDRLAALGSSYGEFPVRDWFWAKTLQVESPLQYVALMGLGFEAGNLEHAGRFEGLLRDAGDEESAAIVGQVGREEVSHVAFACRWFCEWTGADPADGPEFDQWRGELPSPLSPSVLRGRPIHRERRQRAGLSEVFIDRLDAFVDEARPLPCEASAAEGKADSSARDADRGS